jgi:hypothetical protein
MDIIVKQTEQELSKLDIREKMMAFQKYVCKLPGALEGDSPEYLAVCPLTHIFLDGMYMREIFMPKGTMIISKIHKKTHPYFVLIGKVSVLTEKEVVTIQAPFSGVTKAGTKRILYIHEDTTWITIHATNETDLDIIENEIIAKSFEEIENGGIL